MLTIGVSVALLLAACGGPVGIVRGDLQGETGLGTSPTHASISGRVLDASGDPVEGAYVLTEPRGFEARADADGLFELPWLPPGELNLVTTAPGWEPARSEALELLAGDLLDLTLVLAESRPRGVLTVTVTDPSGAPVQDALVRVSDGSEGVSDSDGVVVIEGVVGEDLSLTVVDEAEDLHPRSVEGVLLTEGGGFQWSPQLSGRPDGEVGYYGQTWCSYCHAELVEDYEASPHGRAFLWEPDGELAGRLDQGLELELQGAALILRREGEVVLARLEDSLGELLELEVLGFLGDSQGRSVPLVALGEQRYPLPVVWVASQPQRAGFPCSEGRLLPFEPERWLDDDGSLVLVGGAPLPASSAEASCLPCHVMGFELSARDDGGVDIRFEGAEGWQDDGVGCERCHGPAESHLYSMSPRDIVQPQLLDTDRANEVCAQCHSHRDGLHSGMPHPFGEERPYQAGELLSDTTVSTAESWGSGAAALAHMQHDELLASGHGPAGADLRCVDCHAVHGNEHGALLPGLLRATVSDNALCEGCHWRHSFGGDSWAAVEHMAHRFYDPAGPQEAGRCVHCHMPATATDAGWCEETGAGSLSSHRFESLSPQHTVDVFQDLGVERLPAGQAPPHACVDCHTWNAWYFESLGLGFRGPQGDPALLSTHEDYLDAHGEMFP
jgi:predicted CXXCH cytochrome family protein